MSAMVRTAIVLAVTATPALAAGDAFFSLANTDFVVTVAFLVFLGVLIYYRVPNLIGGLLDKRAERIKAELDEARALREEAQTVLASYERKMQEVKDQAARIVAHAKVEAADAAEIAKAELARTIERRLKAAEDRIGSAEAAAVRDVRDSAVQIAVGAAGDVIAKSMTASDSGKTIDDAIATVDAKLH